MECLQVGGAPVEGYWRTGCFVAEPAIVPKPYVGRWKTAMRAYDQVEILKGFYGLRREEGQHYLAGLAGSLKAAPGAPRYREVSPGGVL